MLTTIHDELSSQNIEPSDILHIAFADMNDICEYQDSYIILTNKNLNVLICNKDTKPGIFSGFPKKEKDIRLIDKEIDILEKLTFNISDLSDAKISDLVSGGLFSFIKDGEEVNISVFSNRCKQDFHKLCSKINALIKSEPLPDDEEGENRFCPTCGLTFPDRDRQICPHCLKRTTVFKRILLFFKPHIRYLVPLFIAFLGVPTMSAIWPYLTGTILYDNILKGKLEFLEKFGVKNASAITALLILALTMAGMRTLQQIFVVIQGRLTAKIVPQVVREIKIQTFAALERMPISFFIRKQTGGLMSRVIEDSERVTGFFIDGLPWAVINIFVVSSALVLMALINWQLTLVSLIFLPLIFIILFILKPRLWSMYGRRHRASRKLHSQINDNLTGARVVKVFGKEKTEQVRFDKSANNMMSAELSIVRMDNKIGVMNMVVQNILTLSTFLIGGYFVLYSKELQYGQLIGYLGYTSTLIWPLEFFARLPSRWSESMNCAQRLCEILDAKPGIVERFDAVEMPYMRGDLILDNVSFGYEPNKDVLKNISFHIPEGKMLGIVGKSGAGKTTLVNLISRLYDVDAGDILIDGINVKNLKFSDLRRQITMVSQETYIFIGTVAENIAYGCPEASYEDIVKAAVAASAHDFICKLPDGYDTLIGGGQRDLSGGERQRLSIARAILVNPRILILDEATAAMDTKTERKIQAALSKLIVGRTTISIAHRLSTLYNADELIVIDNGKITEQGTHMELIHKKGEYFKLVQLQSKALAMREIE